MDLYVKQEGNSNLDCVLCTAIVAMFDGGKGVLVPTLSTSCATRGEGGLVPTLSTRCATGGGQGEEEGGGGRGS